MATPRHCIPAPTIDSCEYMGLFLHRKLKLQKCDHSSAEHRMGGVCWIMGAGLGGQHSHKAAHGRRDSPESLQETVELHWILR